MGWESLGGRLTSAPAVTSWAANEMQVFAIHGDGALWNRYWDGEHWHDWESLGGDLVGDPAACSWGAERIDLFARGRDGSLRHCWYQPGGWTAWESLGGELASDPTACSWGPGGALTSSRAASAATCSMPGGTASAGPGPADDERPAAPKAAWSIAPYTSSITAIVTT